MPDQLEILIPSTAILNTRKNFFTLHFMSGWIGKLPAASGAVIRACVLRGDGELEVVYLALTTMRVVAASVYAFSLPEGHLLSLVLYSTTITINKGDFYCQIVQMSGTAALNFPIRAILAGWLYYQDPLSYPEHAYEDPGPEQCPQELTAFIPPAVGDMIIQDITEEQNWIINGLYFSLTTNAGGAARVVELDFMDPVNYIYSFTARTAQAGGLDYYYQAHKYFDLPVDAPPYIFIPLPEMKNTRAWHIETYVDTFTALDSFGALYILYQQGFRRLF